MSRKRKRKQRRSTAPVQTGGREPAVASPRSAAPKPKPQPRPRPQPARSAPAGIPEAPFDRASLGSAGLAGLVALVVYLLTVDPSVPTGDSGELVTSAYVLGVAHPPGYPLFTMLGHLASLLPFGSPALRINLLSCLFSAAAVAVVFLAIYRLVGGAAAVAPVRQRSAAFVAGAVGALLLAFSSLFWAYSVVAEVFALNNLFAASLLLVAVEWARHPERTRLLWAFAFLFGLALTNQQTIVLLVPAFLVLAWAGWSALGRAGARGSLRLRQLGVACALFVAGLLPYLYLPLAALADPVVNWGDPTTFDRFMRVVTRGDYGSLSLTVDGENATISEQMRLLSGGLAEAFIGVGIVLALLGLWWAWRHRRAEGLALLLAFFVSGPVFVAYANPAYPDELTKGVVARFYILPSIPIALLAGLGAWCVLTRVEMLRRPSLRPGLVPSAAAALLLAVPVAAAVLHYRTADQSDNYVALHYAQDVLRPLAQDALLLTRGDENFTSIGYAQYVEHFRPDVVALDTELLKLPSYVSQKRREHPGIVIPFESYRGETSLDSLISRNLEQRAVYSVGVQEDPKFGASFDSVIVGFGRRLLPKGTALAPEAQLDYQTQVFEQLHIPDRSYPSTSWEAAIAAGYSTPTFDLALAYERQGGAANLRRAEELYREAVRLGPNQAAPLKNLGLLLYKKGGDSDEVIEFWDRYLELAPDDPQAASISQVLGQLKSKR